MTEEEIEKTFFVVILGGLSPQERRTEMHLLYGAYMSNSLDDYLMNHPAGQTLRDLHPRTFREFLFYNFFGNNLAYADVIDLPAESIVIHSIRKRTRQLIELPGVFEDQSTTCMGLPFYKTNRIKWPINDVILKMFNFLFSDPNYSQKKMELFFYGEWKEACVTGVKSLIESVFSNHFPLIGISSKIEDALTVGYDDVKTS